MPQIYANSGYGPGTSFTNGGGGDQGPTQYLQALLSRETRAPARMPQRMPAQQAPQAAPARMPARQAAPQMDDYSMGMDREAKKLQLEALKRRNYSEMMEQQAMLQPAPMRQVSGAQIIPGMTMDTNAMNAYQRQAYLPHGASSGPMGPSGAGLSPMPQPREQAEMAPTFDQRRMQSALEQSNAEYVRRRERAAQSAQGQPGPGRT